MDENEEFHSIYLPHLTNYVVPVLQLKNGEIEIGSGMMVKVGDRHFIATAKHCIDGKKVRAIRSVVPLRETQPVTGIRELPILDRGWHDTLDLGYLEIADPEWPELRWDQLCNDRIVNGLVHVVGYPQVLTIPVETIPGRLTDLSLAAGTFSTSLIEETPDCMTFDYPVMGLRYDPQTRQWNPSPFPVTPHGFSGGACFGITKPAGHIAHVEYKLLGIQYAWMEQRRVVLVVPIRRWRELLMDRGLALA